MPPCRATKGNGEACKAPATGSHGYCWAHDPANSEKRRRMASKAARSKPNREIASIKAQLAEMVDTVLSGAVPTAPYAVANQLLNTRLRAIELERKVKELDELEARLAELEQSPEGSKRWGT